MYEGGMSFFLFVFLAAGAGFATILAGFLQYFQEAFCNQSGERFCVASSRAEGRARSCSAG
jgi:hypothetical protein